MLKLWAPKLKYVGMPSKSMHDALVVVLGATGTGKSQLAVDLAKRFNGEIINGDAMQMYEGLPIITNKITIEEQQGIPHHLLGTVGLEDEPWRVGMFKQKAGDIIREIRLRGRLPILVGGTHYYMQSLLFNDTLVSDHVEQEKKDYCTQDEINSRFPILQQSPEEILAELRLVDPVMADRWHPNDARKIRRSLEIYLTTGQRASDVYQSQRARAHDIEEIGTKSSDPFLRSSLLFWVHADPDILKPRLDNRVDSMVKSGLIEEVKQLDEYLYTKTSGGDDVDRTRGIWVSIGFKEFEPYLIALKSSSTSAVELERLYNDAVERTKASTRQYSKQQIRWIRIKLLQALQREQAAHQIFLLDGSNLDKWDENVKSPAFEITQRFLAGEELPEPSSLSPAAGNILSLNAAENAENGQDSWVRFTCETCNTTLVTEEQINSHLKSRAHRRLMKKASDRGDSWKQSRKQPLPVVENTQQGLGEQEQD